MSGHQAQVPARVAEYFHIRQQPASDDHPVISHQFTPAKGWKPYPIRKRVSTNWLRKMRAEGITHVGLTCHDRTADFEIAEILRSA